LSFKNIHSCLVNGTVVKDFVTKRAKTAYGPVDVIMGKTILGATRTRSIKIPASVPIYLAQELCRLRGGKFTPATPISPSHLLSEVINMRKSYRVEIVEAIIKNFDFPEVEGNVKLGESLVNMENLVKNNKTPLKERKRLVKELISLSKVGDVKVKKRDGFTLSDLLFYLDLLG
jgi:hypothetical protein